MERRSTCAAPLPEIQDENLLYDVLYDDQCPLVLATIGQISTGGKQIQGRQRYTPPPWKRSCTPFHDLWCINFPWFRMSLVYIIAFFAL